MTIIKKGDITWHDYDQYFSNTTSQTASADPDETVKIMKELIAVEFVCNILIFINIP